MEKVTITPSMAEKLLEGNTNNRNISKLQVDRLAKDMKAGNWQFNGETIKVANDGTLLDGQHRLKACVISGTPFETAIVYDLPKNAIESIDTGRRRGDNDILKIKGFISSRELVTVVKRLILAEQGVNPALAFESSKRSTITTHDILEYCESHPRSVEVIQKVKAKNATIKNLGITTSTVSFLFLLFEQIAGTDLATEFFEILYDTDRPLTATPIDVLRKTYWEQAAKRRAYSRKTSYDDPILMIKAWNAYVTGKTVKTLSVYAKETHNPPEIKAPKIIAGDGFVESEGN